MKVSLDREKCLSSGQCLMAAPPVFDQRDEDGRAYLLQEHPADDLAKAVRHAAALCPGLAIKVED